MVLAFVAMSRFVVIVIVPEPAAMRVVSIVVGAGDALDDALPPEAHAAATAHTPTTIRGRMVRTHSADCDRR
jgi:hypothetical protein